MGCCLAHNGGFLTSVGVTVGISPGDQGEQPCPWRRPTREPALLPPQSSRAWQSPQCVSAILVASPLAWGSPPLPAPRMRWAGRSFCSFAPGVGNAGVRSSPWGTRAAQHTVTGPLLSTAGWELDSEDAQGPWDGEETGISVRAAVLPTVPGMPSCGSTAASASATKRLPVTLSPSPSRCALTLRASRSPLALGGSGGLFGALTQPTATRCSPSCSQRYTHTRDGYCDGHCNGHSDLYRL